MAITITEIPMNEPTNGGSLRYKKAGSYCKNIITGTKQKVLV